MFVIAHRGLPAIDRPENSVAACVAALDGGADGVEVDLRLTKDGVLVASHDPDLSRLTGTSVAVADQTWRTLVRQAAASGVELARVEQILSAARSGRVVLEVKQPPPAPSANRRIAARLCEQLTSPEVSGERITVSSFSPAVLREVRALLPPQAGVRTALLGRPLTRTSSLLRQALRGGHDEIHPHVLSVLATPEAVTTAHAVGVAVVPWTANRARDLRRLARAGADGVITDRPATARLLVQAAAAAS